MAFLNKLVNSSDPASMNMSENTSSRGSMVNVLVGVRLSIMFVHFTDDNVSTS